jgi:hypothetical protein
MGEIVGGGIEDAGLSTCSGLAFVIDGGEATQGDAEGEAQMISGSLRVEFFDVFGKGISFWSIDGGLCPVLGMAPR